MKRILIVDDESRIRRVYAWLLSVTGYQTFEAANAVDAHELLRKEPVDLVLLDINLPDMRGDSFNTVLSLFHRDTRVIVTSVYPVDKQKRLINGVAEYYDKSHGIDELLRKVERQVGHG